MQSDIPNFDEISELYNGTSEFEYMLLVKFANMYLKKSPIDDSIIFKSLEDLARDKIPVCGVKSNGTLETWAQPIDPCEYIGDSLQISQAQRTYLNRLFTNNYSDYSDDSPETFETSNDRINYLCNGVYKRQYKVLDYYTNSNVVSDINIDGNNCNDDTSQTSSTHSDDVNDASYIPLVKITLSDDNERLVPYFHMDIEQPINVMRNLGHWGPNFAIDVVLTCGENIICMLRRPRDESGSVTSRSGSSRTITALADAGTPASIAAIGGMLETLAGPLTAFKELLEEACLTPEDVLGSDTCPELLKTRNWVRKNPETHKPYTPEQIIAMLPENKRDNAEAFYEAYLDNASFLYQATIYGAMISTYKDINGNDETNNVKTADLLRECNYVRLGEILRPVLADPEDEYGESAVSPDTMTQYIEDAMHYLMNEMPTAFNLQVMETDKRNTSVAFMVSSGIRIEIPESTFNKLMLTYSNNSGNSSNFGNFNNHCDDMTHKSGSSTGINSRSEHVVLSGSSSTSHLPPLTTPNTTPITSRGPSPIPMSLTTSRTHTPLLPTQQIFTVSNSESAGLVAFSARELAAYYNNPELYQRALTAVDCDKVTTLKVTNIFTNLLTPVWRTHLDTLIMIAHNIMCEHTSNSDSHSQSSIKSNQDITEDTIDDIHNDTDCDTSNDTAENTIDNTQQTNTTTNFFGNQICTVS